MISPETAPIGTRVRVIRGYEHEDMLPPGEEFIVSTYESSCSVGEYVGLVGTKSEQDAGWDLDRFEVVELPKKEDITDHEECCLGCDCDDHAYYKEYISPYLFQEMEKVRQDGLIHAKSEPWVALCGDKSATRTTEPSDPSINCPYCKQCLRLMDDVRGADFHFGNGLVANLVSFAFDKKIPFLELRATQLTIGDFGLPAKDGWHKREWATRAASGPMILVFSDTDRLVPGSRIRKEIFKTFERRQNHGLQFHKDTKIVIL